jgi:hypothetical protein
MRWTLVLMVLLWPFAAVAQTSENASKVTGFTVLQGIDQRASKVTGFAVLQTGFEANAKMVGFVVLSGTASTVRTQPPPGLGISIGIPR